MVPGRSRTPRKRRPSVQVAKKAYIGRCLFCGEADLRLLDAHRAYDPGGRYTWEGVVPCCATCHRKAHAGLIVVHGRYPTTAGYHVVHCTVDGEERWTPETPAA